MELESWLAKDYEVVDDYTMKINLRDDVTFSNGNEMTGDAVKDCIESLVRLHDRAPSDLAIVSIDATQCLPYASLDLFRENDEYKISTANTSRVYQMAYNYENKDLQDKKVRQAIAKAINKEDFTKKLLNGNGTPAVGAFPLNF